MFRIIHVESRSGRGQYVKNYHSIELGVFRYQAMTLANIDQDMYWHIGHNDLTHCGETK